MTVVTEGTFAFLILKIFLGCLWVRYKIQAFLKNKQPWACFHMLILRRRTTVEASYLTLSQIHLLSAVIADWSLFILEVFHGFLLCLREITVSLAWQWSTFVTWSCTSFLCCCITCVLPPHYASFLPSLGSSFLLSICFLCLPTPEKAAYESSSHAAAVFSVFTYYGFVMNPGQKMPRSLVCSQNWRPFPKSKFSKDSPQTSNAS